MYQQFYSDGVFLHLPLVALFVFLTAFVGVIAWAVWLAPRGRVAPELERIAALPLYDNLETHRGNV